MVGVDRGLPLGAARTAATGALAPIAVVGAARSPSCWSGGLALLPPDASGRSRTSSELSDVADHGRGPRQALPPRRSASRYRRACATRSSDRLARSAPRCDAGRARRGRADLGAARRRPSRSRKARSSASSAATAPARARCSRSSRASPSRRRARATVARPRRRAARGRHRLPSGADRPREHLPERRDPRHAPREIDAQVRRDRRLRRASSSSSTRRSSATRAACTCGWRSRSRRTSSRRSCSSTRCSPSATPSSRRSASARWATSRRSGRTVLFVSHNMAAVESLCDRAMWLEGGRCVGIGAPGEIAARYLATSSTPRRMIELGRPGSRPGNERVRIQRALVRQEAGRRSPIDVRRRSGSSSSAGTCTTARG